MDLWDTAIDLIEVMILSQFHYMDYRAYHGEVALFSIGKDSFYHMTNDAFYIFLFHSKRYIIQRSAFRS